MSRTTWLSAATVLLVACTDVTEPGASREAMRQSLSPRSSSGAVIYSNFGADMSFDANPAHGWTINGYLGPTIGRQAIAQQFTPASRSVFQSAQLALSAFSGPATVDVYLQKDAEGLPGDVIERMTVTGLTATPAVFTATSTLLPTLVGDRPYWLSVVAPEAGTIGSWSWNSTGDASITTFAGTQDGSPSGAWGTGPVEVTRGAFQINGKVYPGGAATPTITNVTSHVDVTLWIPCVAEDVTFSGEVHQVFEIVYNENGYHLTFHSNPQGVSGTGLTTGDKYQAAGMPTAGFGTLGTQNNTYVKPLAVFTGLNNYRYIGQGPGNNFQLHDNFHGTIDANGVVTITHDNFTYECK